MPQANQPTAPKPVSYGPKSLYDIPGIGPIRVRALQKAGFTTLVALWEASEEQIAAVPGISPTKARQIKAFLQQFPPEKTKAQQEVVYPAADAGWLRVVSLPRNATPVQKEARTLFREIVVLLLAPPATRYRRRLLRALLLLLQRCAQLLQDPQDFSVQQEEHLSGALQNLFTALQPVVAKPLIDEKEQLRLTRLIRKTLKWLGSSP